MQKINSLFLTLANLCAGVGLFSILLSVTGYVSALQANKIIILSISTSIILTHIFKK